MRRELAPVDKWLRSIVFSMCKAKSAALPICPGSTTRSSVIFGCFARSASGRARCVRPSSARCTFRRAISSSVSRLPSLAARPFRARLPLRASVAGRIVTSTRRSATTSRAPTIVFTTKGEENPIVAVWQRTGDLVRMFWAAERGKETAEPGFNPRLAPDSTPLWTILDWTPGRCGSNWYPKLEY